jgi:hypothetical protein
MDSPKRMLRDFVTLYTEDGEEVVVIYSIRRDGNRLIVDGKALGAMRIDMVLSVREVLKGLKIAFSWGVVSFIFLLPYFVLKSIFARGGRGDSSGN